MRTALILLLIAVFTPAAPGVEVTRSRIYESSYQPITIIALLVDGLRDTSRSAILGGGGIVFDRDSVKFDLLSSPWRIEYSYSLSVDGIYVTKRTVVTASRIWQSIYVTGDIGELSSAYLVSDARQHSEGTTIINTLTVEWHPKSRCRLLRGIAGRVASRRVIPPLVDDGLRQLEKSVVDLAQSGVLWPFLKAIKGGLE